MRNIALASQTGKNGTQRQQSFHDAPASACLLFVQSPGHSPMFSHGWGDPEDPRPTREKGSNVQVLIPRDSDYDPLTGLAQQSAFPVNILPQVPR